MSFTCLRTFGVATSWVVSPSRLPTVAKYSAATADRPEVEKSGFVWPSLNCPNCGLPTEPQPLLLVASLRISPKPTGFFGQPSARASGSHMAITSGVRTIDGEVSGAYGLSAWKFRSRPHSDDA